MSPSVSASISRSIVYALPPLACFALILAAYMAGEPYLTRIVTSHTGFEELICGVFLLLAFVICLCVIFQPAVRANKRLRVWLIAYAVGMFYFMGEDQNWGQYLFDLAVPDYFLENNKEQELNLHNMSSWFNQKPRLVVEIWVIVVGVLVPLGWSWPQRVTRNFVPPVLWADRRILVSALLAMASAWPERLHDHGLLIPDAWMAIRFSEVQEVFLAWVMLLYITMLYCHLRGAQPSHS